jgi:hypothetical protein
MLLPVILIIVVLLAALIGFGVHVKRRIRARRTQS